MRRFTATLFVYMDISEKMQAINDLDQGAIALKDPEAIKNLMAVYAIVFGETLSGGCGDCVNKAYYKLKSITFNKLETMNNSKFKLKNDVLIPTGDFGSGEFLSKANLTDEAAYSLLSEFPNYLDQFEEYPRNEDGSFNPNPENEIQFTAVDTTDIGADDSDLITQEDLDKHEDLVKAGVSVGDNPATVEAKLNAVTKAADPNDVAPEVQEIKVPDLSNITKKTLQEQYFTKVGSIPEDSLTKPELWKAINIPA